MWSSRKREQQEFLKEIKGMQHGANVSCLNVDVDLMMALNDNFGHEHGDKVLTRIDDLLKQFCQKNAGCIHYYYNLDNFLILIYKEKNSIFKLCSEIINEVERLKLPFYHSQIKRAHKDIVTVSIGGVTGQISARFCDNILVYLDKALYAAKENQPSGIYILELDEET